MTLLCWDDRFGIHDTGNAALYLYEGDLVQATMPHVDNPERSLRMREVIRRAGLDETLEIVAPEPAYVADLELVHTPQHVARMADVSREGGGDAGGGYTPMDARSYHLALLSSGSAITAVRAVAEGQTSNAYAMVRRAGHHASRETGFGFCIFNNVAVAARVAQRDHGVDRIAIIDIDVHHGNGTEAIFAADPAVLTVSLHQDRMFPPDTGGAGVVGEGPGTGRNVNLPLPAGTGDAGYQLAIDRIVAPVVRDFAPALIIVACGLDASVFDPMARLALTATGFGGVADRLLGLAAESCRGRIVFVQEGGYSPAYAPFCGLAIIEAMAGVARHEDPFEPFLAPSLRELTAWQRDAVDALARRHAPHWPVLATS